MQKRFAIAVEFEPFAKPEGDRFRGVAENPVMTALCKSKTLANVRPGLRVLVTAGASGIGLAMAETLIRHDANVYVCDISEALVENFKLRYPQQHASLADVSSETEVAQLFLDIESQLGGLDALVNNAGIAGPTGRIEETSLEEWCRCINVCLTGQFLCARQAVPMLKRAGGGAIVNMSSAAGRHGYAFRTAYASAKFGVIGLSASLAKELGPYNIRVNSILPGLVAGPRIEGVIRARATQLGLSYDEMEAEYLEKISLRRMVTADDVAAMVLFLLSPMGQNLSGQSIGVDGNVETL